MKYADINKKYTELVSEYIAKGYTINASTMGGSQGETARIDLTDGSKIIRILVHNFSDWKANLEGEEIIVGRVTDNVVPNSTDTWATIWNDNLEVLHSERFYKIGENRHGKYYGTQAEAEAAVAIKRERYRNRFIASKRNDITEKAMEVAKRVIRNKMGYKRINEADVKVYRIDKAFAIQYKGKTHYVR